jgi:hypothetical protein
MFDGMLLDLAFKAPVTVEDVTAVRDALRLALPGTAVEVYFHTGARGDDVVIRVDGVTRKVAVS